jgi:hypothetical protein
MNYLTIFNFHGSQMAVRQNIWAKSRLSVDPGKFQDILAIRRHFKPLILEQRYGLIGHNAL